MKAILIENKKIFIIAGISFIVLFLLILIVSLFNNKDDNLILNCSENVQMENFDIIQSFKLYDYSDSKKLVLIMHFNVDNKLKEQMETYMKLMKVQMENKLKVKFGENYSDIKLDTIIEKDKFEIQIEWNLNENNKAQMTEIFGVNFLETDVEELKNTFQSGGLSCD